MKKEGNKTSIFITLSFDFKFKVMKRILFFVLFGLSLSLFSQFAVSTTFQSNHATAEDFFLDADYVPSYYRLEMNLNPYQANFSGKTTMKFTTTTSTNIVKINAQANLSISNVSYHSTPITTFSRNGNVLTIPLPNSLPSNHLDSISISFTGNAANSNGLNLGMHAGVPVIETLAEPWHASSWWVCKDDLIDKVEKIDILISHPSEFKAASNGSLKSVTSAGNGNSTTHWQHNYSIPAYLVAAAVTNYVEYNNSVNVSGTTVPIINYMYPETLSGWTSSLDAVPSYIEFLSEKFGDYPYKNEKYGHAQWNRGGGMEHSTMSFMGGFNFSLVTHELAHQWFGNKVTCSTWHDIWINEGFADYCAGLLTQHVNGETTFRNWKDTRIENITAQNWGSVYCPDAENQSRIFDSRLTYRKGSMVVHLIRFILNDDELFYQSLRNFLDDPNFSYGYAGTQDFKASLEASTGRNWDNYFEDWIYGEGHPIFDIHLNHNPNSNNYTLTFQQSSSHNSVDFFETPFEIKFNGSAGQSETRRFDLTQSPQSFTVDDLPFTVTSYVANPNFDVICKVNSAILSTNEIQKIETLIYPNPAKSEFTIESPKTIQNVNVFDSSGKMIFRTSNINQFKLQIPTHNWPNGVYSVQIQVENQRVIKKLIIQ